MPKHSVHDSKKQKNVALLLLLVAMIALFYGMTIVKISDGTTAVEPTVLQPTVEEH